MQLLRLASLVAVAVLLASSADAKASTTCVTAKGGKRGTRTHQLPAKTVTVYDVVNPTERVTRVIKPAPKTSTTVIPQIVTVTKKAKADVDVVVTTSTSFKVVVPSTTVEAPTVTPAAVTSTVIEANTNTVTTTVTSYNEEPPAPTLAPLARRDQEEDETEEDEAEAGVLGTRASPIDARAEPSCTTPKPKSASALKKHRASGKDVYCHAVVKKHVTTKGRAVTVTATRNVNPGTWVATSTLTFTSTKTEFPAEITSTLTVSKKATITAPTVTVTVTPTVAPPTSVKTILAPQPTERVVSNLLSTCDPKKRFQLAAWSAMDADTLKLAIGITKDADSCCSAIGNIPGAVGWAYSTTGTNFIQGSCFGSILYSAELCDAQYQGTTLKAVAGADEVGGLLQCGIDVQWMQA